MKNYHARAIKVIRRAGIEPFPPYTMRHTGLTRLAPYCDAYTLAKIAGHTDIKMTSKYIHPQQHAIEHAFQRGLPSLRGHSQGASSSTFTSCEPKNITNRNVIKYLIDGEPWGSRTLNLLIKSQLLYQLS